MEKKNEGNPLLRFTKLQELKQVNYRAYKLLEHRYKELLSYEEMGFSIRLSISEAKDLSRKYFKTTDPKDKIKIREGLIIGTLYRVYDFVCDCALTALKTGVFDTDDIINASIETWINLLDSGALLNEKINNYRMLFNQPFYTKTMKSLLEDAESSLCIGSRGGLFVLISKEEGAIALKTYLSYFISGCIVDEKTDYECVVASLYGLKDFKNLSSDEIFEIYTLFSNIRKILTCDDLIRVSQTDLSYIKKILVGFSLYDGRTRAIEQGDFTDDVHNEMMYDDVRTMIYDESILPSSWRKVILDSCGFTGDIKKNKEIAKEIGHSEEWVRRLKSKAELRLRKNKTIRGWKYY